MSQRYKSVQAGSRALFKKHNLNVIGYWVPAPGAQSNNVWTYLVAHASKDAADKNWAAFYADPQWKAAISAAEKDGKLVDSVDIRFMTPAEFSPLK